MDAITLTRAFARFVPTADAAELATRLHLAGFASQAMVCLHAIEAEEVTDELLDLSTGELASVIDGLIPLAPSLAEDLLAMVEGRLLEPWAGLMDAPDMLGAPTQKGGAL